jgi:hypothetical protein
MKRCLLALGVVCLALLGCSRPADTSKGTPRVAPPPPRVANPNVPDVQFTDVTDKAGIKFRHNSGAFGKRLLPETMGGGGAFLDYDNDGNVDLLLVNSSWWPGFEEKDKPAPTMALYRNRGDGTFEDATKAAGMAVPFYGLGVAVGDCDNDGWTDVFITGMGGNHLFRNAPGPSARRFDDVTKTAGDLTDMTNWPKVKGDGFLDLEDEVSFPSSTAFLDYDKDGLLDLFVCSYVQWSPQFDLTQGFTLVGLGRAYGPPTTFPGTHCRLYHNQGNGKFTNVTRKAGIEVFNETGRPVGKSLGVAVCDLDEDGWPDIAVANDTVRNFLFHNQKNGVFKEIGREAGIAFAEGVARGAMGIDWGEFRNGVKKDGKVEGSKCAIIIGNFANEPDTLVRLDDPKQILFADVARLEGIAGPSQMTLTFGTLFFDYDLDGRLDILANNGHLEPEIARVQAGQHFAQSPQLFWNTGAAPGFELVPEDKLGKDLHKPLVGRGHAVADIDGNGTLDVVLLENGGPPRLLKNHGRQGHHWVRFILEGDGKKVNKSALGARIALTAGNTVQRREIAGAKGYLSSSDLAVTFGLGKADKIERVEIHWPGKDTEPQVLTDVAVDKTHRVRMK